MDVNISTVSRAKDARFTLQNLIELKLRSEKYFDFKKWQAQAKKQEAQ